VSQTILSFISSGAALVLNIDANAEFSQSRVADFVHFTFPLSGDLRQEIVSVVYPLPKDFVILTKP